MFNLSGSEIVVILLLALVVLGPEKLPDAIRRAGRTYAELKKMGNSFQAEMKSVLDEPMKEMRETADLLKKSVDFTEGGFSATAPTSPTTGTAAPSRLASASTAPDDAAPPTTAEPADTGSVAEAAAPPADDAAADEPARPLSPEDELINRTLSGEQ